MNTTCVQESERRIAQLEQHGRDAERAAAAAAAQHAGTHEALERKAASLQHAQEEALVLAARLQAAEETVAELKTAVLAEEGDAAATRRADHLAEVRSPGYDDKK